MRTGFRFGLLTLMGWSVALAPAGPAGAEETAASDAAVWLVQAARDADADAVRCLLAAGADLIELRNPTLRRG